jgi:ribonuclease HII
MDRIKEKPYKLVQSAIKEGMDPMKIAEIKRALEQEPGQEELAKWREDSRKGVQDLLKAYDLRIARKQKEAERIWRLMGPERELWANGIQHVAGTDEAGRGPLAGPLVTAAVILPHEIDLPGLNDSKQVTPKRREELYDEIRQQALAITISVLGPKEIDEMNIYQAARYAMTQCLTHLSVKPGAALSDAMPLSIEGLPVASLVHGDSRSAAIAAASIMAKVTRDRMLVELDRQYPQYGFAGHKGYGSQAHMDAIRKYGVTPWHRRSYEPVKSMAETGNLGPAISENRLIRLK